MSSFADTYKAGDIAKALGQSGEKASGSLAAFFDKSKSKFEAPKVIKSVKG